MLMYTCAGRGITRIGGTRIAIVAVHRVMLAARAWAAGVGGAGVAVVAVRRRAALVA